MRTLSHPSSKKLIMKPEWLPSHLHCNSFASRFCLSGCYLFRLEHTLRLPGGQCPSGGHNLPFSGGAPRTTPAEVIHTAPRCSAEKIRLLSRHGCRLRLQSFCQRLPRLKTKQNQRRGTRPGLAASPQPAAGSLDGAAAFYGRWRPSPRPPSRARSRRRPRAAALHSRRALRSVRLTGAHL